MWHTGAHDFTFSWLCPPHVAARPTWYHLPRGVPQLCPRILPWDLPWHPSASSAAIPTAARKDG